MSGRVRIDDMESGEARIVVEGEWFGHEQVIKHLFLER
jgi:hypothetical protein